MLAVILTPDDESLLAEQRSQYKRRPRLTGVIKIRS